MSHRPVVFRCAVMVLGGAPKLVWLTLICVRVFGDRRKVTDKLHRLTWPKFRPIGESATGQWMFADPKRRSRRRFASSLSSVLCSDHFQMITDGPPQLPCLMLSDANAPALKILILKADTLCASVVEHVAKKVFPGAHFRRETSLARAISGIAADPVDLLLTGLGLPDGDALDLLTEKVEQRNFKRALVITSRTEHRILSVLLPLHGIFDPNSEGLDELENAIRTAASGGRYWSPNILERLNGLRPSKWISRLLSPTEELVFAVLGDGSDDESAAERLGLKPSTIHSVRRELHRKLNVQHKGELVRMAAQQGYVRFTANGVLRPGFAALLAACRKTLLPESVTCSRFTR